MKKAKKAQNRIDESLLTPLQRYSCRLLEFERYYLTILLLCAAAVCSGIAVALLLNLFVGVASVILAALAYVYFVCDEAHGQLGIRYRNICGGIVITSLTPAYGDCLVLPKKFIYADVRELGDGALASQANGELSLLYLPSTLKKIGRDIFGDSERAVCICFEGTREAWESIECLTDLSHCELCFECKYPRAEQIPPQTKETEAEQ